MQTNNILSAPLIDIIFDGRNKAYGAYELRIQYNKRIRKALLITAFLTSLVFGSMVMASSLKKNGPQYRINEGVVLKEIEEQKKPEKLPEQDKPKPKPPEVRTQKYVDIAIKPDDQVETPPPSNIELENAKVGLETKTGVDDQGFAEPVKENIGEGKSIVEDKRTTSDEPIGIVEIDAKFDGNWKAFLERNLNADVPVSNGAPAGRYSVVIRFVVDVDGTVSDITPLTAHGYGLEEEAVRVIKKTKKWEPAFQNGIHVKAYKKQVIVFEVVE